MSSQQFRKKEENINNKSGAATVKSTWSQKCGDQE